MKPEVVYRSKYPTEPGWWWVLVQDDKTKEWYENARYFDKESIAIYSKSGPKEQPGPTLFYAGPFLPPKRPA